MNIHNYLPNGEKDLERAGCEDEGCSGSGYALVIGGVFDEVILCEPDFRKYQSSGDIQEADEVYTLD